MDQTFHEPVLVDRVLELFAPVASGTVIDATFGGGGHSTALLDRYPELRVIGIDRDPDAVASAVPHPRLSVQLGNFADLIAAHESPGAAGGVVGVDGVLMDLGVSSHQLDVAGRGFSYHRDGPIDMRMGGEGTSAAERLVQLILNPVSEFAALLGNAIHH
jgi:16S rRNA (cytosine1402-N4)-methyltransferase